MTLVWKSYPATALVTTNTAPSEMSDFGLTIDDSVSANWKLEWKLTFHYSSTSGGPRFDITYPEAGSFWATDGQLYREWDQPISGSDVGTYDNFYQGVPGAGEANLGTVPLVTDGQNGAKWYVLTMTAMIFGYAGAGSGGTGQATVYPTWAVANSGDSAHLIQGYGISTSF